MRNGARWLAVLLGGAVLGTFASIGGVRAQQAPPAPSEYGGPYISNPGAIPPEELKRQEQIHEAYCRKHPDACIGGALRRTPEGLKREEEEKRYRGPYVPPNPANTAPVAVTHCHPDPATGRTICVDEPPAN